MPDTPRITFSLFVLSISASAEIHLGAMPAPGSDRPARRNLTEAAHLIEVLSMLEQKTANNLDESEARLLEAVLHDLRARYAEAVRADTQVQP